MLHQIRAGAFSRPGDETFAALEVQGLVEVRIGSGAYVTRLPGEGDVPGFNITAFELTEARLLFEGEAAALAATQISDEELAEMWAELCSEEGLVFDPAPLRAHARACCNTRSCACKTKSHKTFANMQAKSWWS